MMFRIDSRHWKISTSRHFQNGCHNTAKIQHCPISIVAAILKMATGRNFSMSGINSGHLIYPHIKFWWYQTMMNFYRQFFMPCFGSHFENGRHLENFYQSPFSKWLPQYRKNSTLSDINDISYVGRLWCPELIPDIEKFLPVSIFKMATTILQKFNIIY
jgi:hypothetical protein